MARDGEGAPGPRDGGDATLVLQAPVSEELPLEAQSGPSACGFQRVPAARVSSASAQAREDRDTSVTLHAVSGSGPPCEWETGAGPASPGLHACVPQATARPWCFCPRQPCTRTWAVTSGLRRARRRGWTRGDTRAAFQS